MKNQHHIFTYGSLMFGRVWSRIVSGHYTALPATLHGYQCLAVKGEEYPVAVPASPAASIAGILYLDVNSTDIARLDDFEGEYYLRLTTPVTIASGDTVAAETYILKPDYRHIAEAFEWDIERFRTNGIGHFIARYQGFS